MLFEFSKTETEIFQPLLGQRAKEYCRLGAEGSTFIAHSAKGSLPMRQRCYQHRNQRLTCAHRGALQAFQSLFGDPSSLFSFFLLSLLLIFILLSFITPLPSASLPDVQWYAFTDISWSLLGSAQKPSPWEAWVRGMLRFPAVFHHSGCQFWLLQVSGIKVNGRILLPWYIISSFMHYFLPSDLYLCILHLLFFCPPKTFLLVVPTKIKQLIVFLVLILTAVIFTHWENRVCIPVLTQMNNSHIDHYMLQHWPCFNSLTHYLCGFAITFYYVTSLTSPISLFPRVDLKDKQFL